MPERPSPPPDGPPGVLPSPARAMQTSGGGGGLSPTPLALFESHLRHATLSARRIARRLPRCVRREDVEAAALCGLWRAALAWDPGRGLLFWTYAAWRVRGEVLDALRADVGLGRSRLHAPPRLYPLPDGLASPPDPRPALADLRDRLAPLRRLLPWRGRVLLRLVYDEGMTQDAAACVLGLSACYLGALHARALAAMRAGAGGMTPRPGL
jgi:RNA polymerase sigma factor (sigma-70 family)